MMKQNAELGNRNRIGCEEPLALLRRANMQRRGGKLCAALIVVLLAGLPSMLESPAAAYAGMPQAKTRTRGNQPTQNPRTAQPGILNGLANSFVPIAAGEFMMGSQNGYNNEKPVHRVRISRSFEMGKYEVTQAQWSAVMGNNPSFFKGANLPVEQVS